MAKYEVYSMVDGLGDVYMDGEGVLVGEFETEDQAWAAILEAGPASYIKRTSDGATMYQGTPWVNSDGEEVA